MNTVRDFKEKVESTENMEETERVIEDSGMELSLDDMDEVAGGERPLTDLRPTFRMGRGVK